MGKVSKIRCRSSVGITEKKKHNKYNVWCPELATVIYERNSKSISVNMEVRNIEGENNVSIVPSWPRMWVKLDKYPIPGSQMIPQRRGELMTCLICSRGIQQAHCCAGLLWRLTFWPPSACFAKVKFSCWCSDWSPTQCKVKRDWWNRAIFNFSPCFAVKDSPLTLIKDGSSKPLELHVV